jgi:hypothetical protein
MLTGLSGGIRQNIIKEIKRTKKVSGQWETKKNTGFSKQLYCVGRPENFGIIPPSNHSRKPVTKTRHQPAPDQEPADTSVPGQYPDGILTAGRCF